MVRYWRGWRIACLFVMATGLVLTAATAGVAQLRPDPEALAAASPELLERLQATAFDYFRFVNRPWIARVCDVFSGDLRDVPIVRLHGDAHVEQFALTGDAWGLDDFDDSARGPALIDIVRFLGSLDLAARERRWTRDRDALFKSFLDGYRLGLAQPGVRPPQPDIVRRLRAQAHRSRAEFLAWGETLMVPMSQQALKAVVAGEQIFAALMSRERPEFPPGYFTVVRAGWLRMGVGSAVNPKVLIRVQGPTANPADDELLEAKMATDLDDLRCLETKASPPTLRIVDGTRQLGRIKLDVLCGRTGSRDP